MIFFTELEFIQKGLLVTRHLENQNPDLKEGSWMVERLYGMKVQIVGFL